MNEDSQKFEPLTDVPLGPRAELVGREGEPLRLHVGMRPGDVAFAYTPRDVFAPTINVFMFSDGGGVPDPQAATKIAHDELASLRDSLYHALQYVEEEMDKRRMFTRYTDPAP